MGKKILFGVLGFFAGLVISFVLVALVEQFSNIVHPYPPGVEELKGEAQFAAVCKHVGNYPDWVLGVCTLFYGATTVISVWLATRIGGRTPGALLGLLLLAMLMLNVWLMGLPYPLWFKIVVFAVCVPCFLAGLFLLPSQKLSGAASLKTNPAV